MSTPEGPAETSEAALRKLVLEKYEPIAIVGIGLRFPGESHGPDEFAEFLREGRSGIRPVPEDRWDVAGLATDDPEATGRIRMAAGGFLDRIDEFDASFFNISPKEAPYVDPQQRMLLETAWEALEHANIDPARIRRGNGGVYIGASSIDYALEMEGLSYPELDGHLAAGITLFPMSGRLSYFLGLHGPSMTIDTACASSLTALHVAVSGLRRGECDIALCGAVNALHHPRVPVIFTHANMLAPDGQCKTFDDDADGYVRAEGCGVLVLKRFSDARRDGDRVLALVRGTAVGQDGDSAGLTVPNGTAQEMVMRAAIERAALRPADIQYVEAHGTGTPLGDPIEMGAIGDVFAASHTPERPVVVGSVKTNLGHMEPVAGIVGVIKTVLQMRERTVFPHLNFRNPSGRIGWDTLPVRVPTGCVPWTAPTRRALVNSFGFAGTISAVVLEEAPEVRPSAGPAAPAPYVFALSAKTRSALRNQLERYRDHLAANPDVPLADLCWTSTVGRAHHGLRVAAAVDSREALTKLLEDRLTRLDQAAPKTGQFRKAAFLFAGQGAQYAGMGEPLHRRFPVFRQHVDECDRLFAPHLGRSVRELMSGTDPVPGDLDQTRYTQAALFTLEYALAQLWMSWGVRPGVLIGHSIGEVVAAAVAGVLDLPDAVRLVAVRGRLMQSVRQPGGMLAVSAPAGEVAADLTGYPDLAIAAINSPGQCVISGGRDALAEVGRVLSGRGLKVRPLAVSHAFHSPLMTEVFDEFRVELAGIRFHRPAITVISNLTGAVARPADLADPDYWVRHIGEPVNFAAGMETVGRRGRHVCIEIGPGGTLTSLAQQCVPADDHRWLRSMHREDTDGRTVLSALAQAYTAGLAVDWAAYDDGHPRRKAGLPTYGFDRKRYWLPVGRNRHGRGLDPAAGAGASSLLGTEVTTPEQRAEGVREYAVTVTGREPAYLADHRAGDAAVLPLAAHLDALFALQDAVYGEYARPVRDVLLHESVRVGDDGVELRTRLAGATVTVTARPAGDREAAARPVLDAVLGEPEPARPVPVLPAADAPAVPAADGADVHAALAEAGLTVGPAFQRIAGLHRDAPDAVTADLLGVPATPGEYVSPALLESALHAAGALADDGTALVPVAAARMRLLRKPRAERLRAGVRVVARDVNDLVVDVTLADAGGPVAELDGVRLQPAAPRLGGTRVDFLHELVWRQRDAPAPAPADRNRHVVMLGGSDLPADPDVKLSFAGSPEELAGLLAAGRVTDVCWRWRPGGDLRAECEANYTGLLAVLAVLADAGFGRDQRLWLVTERAQTLPGDEPDPRGLGAATLWGFGHVLLNEHPAYRTTLVDVPAGDTASLLAALSTPDTGEFQTAYRNGVRWVRRLVPATVPPATPEAPAPTVTPDHTYLITGGLGGLGLVTAEKLVDLGARHLVLTGRRREPAPEFADRLTRLRERATVTVETADLADPAAVHRLGRALRALPHPVGGIVHAAGSLDDRPVAAQTWESIDALFGPKVYGGWLLHEMTQDMPELRFFVGYSSAASVVGGASQSNYAAANAFLDALMRHRAALGQPALAVNWGPWSDVGMSARLSPQHVRALEAEGIRFFTPARALRALTALLVQPAPQIAVGECDWRVFVPAKPVSNALYEELVAGAGPAAVADFDLAAWRALPAGDQHRALSDLVTDRVAAVLHLDDPDLVEPHLEFVQLGLDSLMAVDVKNRLEAALRIPLPASVAFDHPSVDRLADFLRGQLAPSPAVPALADPVTP